MEKIRFNWKDMAIEIEIEPENSTLNMNIKQERHDEAEIRELAAKFVEANKAKMAQPQRPAGQPGANVNIVNFLSHSQDRARVTRPANETEVESIDIESVKGRFGWTMMGKVHIPFITRAGEHYCSVRMVEMKVLNKLLTYLHQDLYNCTNIRSYYITEAEAKVLNEINCKHCDYQFGRDNFTQRDLIVRVTDANEFYQFLGHCYAKLMNTVDAESLGRCGFIRINRESVVPYTVYNDQKYVPLFYFEGETDNLKQRADKLEGWDLSYLKFCCKVQGIRNELFAHDSCSVISLNDIKNYFPPGTVFEDYWPKKNLDSQLLLSRSSNPQQVVQWTRQPVAPPLSAHSTPSPKPVAQSKPTNNSHLHNLPVYSNYNMPTQPTYHASQPRVVNSVVARATYPGAPANRMRPYFSGMTPAPPPLIRTNNPMAQYNTQQKAAGNYMILESNMNQNSFHQAAQSSYPPPPLLHMNGGIARYEGPRYAGDTVDMSAQNRDLQNSYAAVNNTAAQQIVNQQPHQVPRTQSNATSEDSGERRNAMSMSIPNGRASTQPPVLANRGKLIPIPETPNTGNGIPYKVQKALVEGKMIPCINMKPNSWTDMLVALPDLVTHFFNNIPVQSCQQVMHVLGIDMYKANCAQMRLLTDGRTPIGQDALPLVQVRNVIDYMPQLKYMLSGLISSEVGSKRQRNS